MWVYKEQTVEIFLLITFGAAGAFVYTTSIAVPDDRLKTIYDSATIESGEPVELEGVLTVNPEPSFDGYFLRMRVERLIHDGEEKIVSGEVKLFAPIIDEQIAAEYAEMDLQYGTQIRVACNLEREENFQNPGVILRKTILDQQGIDATANIKSPLLIEVIGHKPVFVLFAWIFDKREELIRDIKQNFDRPTAGVLIASLLGDRYFLDKQTAEVFREGGTFHVLVISGLHITFIGGLTLFVVQMFTRRRFWHFMVASVSYGDNTICGRGGFASRAPATVSSLILAFSQVINRRGTLFGIHWSLCSYIFSRGGRRISSLRHSNLLSLVVGSIVVIAFPLIEKLRAIGKWTPSKNHPFPPAVSMLG
jgi:competence protein ComEC